MVGAAPIVNLVGWTVRRRNKARNDECVVFYTGINRVSMCVNNMANLDLPIAKEPNFTALFAVSTEACMAHRCLPAIS
jgi:hypothetical protein